MHVSWLIRDEEKAFKIGDGLVDVGFIECLMVW